MLQEGLRVGDNSDTDSQNVNWFNQEDFDMETTSFARKAGIIGIVGAVLWIISVILQNGLGVSGPESGFLWVVHELIAIAALIGMMIGFLGLLWGGAFRGPLGTVAVSVHVLAYVLIVLGTILTLLMGNVESPLFVLFPIGGFLETAGALLLGIAALVSGRWTGWQHWMPLLYSLFYLFGIGVPMIAGLTSNGPGMAMEISQGIAWLLVALAVYTAESGAGARHSSVVNQL
jgi:hypothetical protein